MSAHHDDLPPELLAAYVDGELTPAECRRVEAWLADHPEAMADVEAQQRLSRLMDRAAPPAPAEEQWAEALAGVRQSLARPTVSRPAWRVRVAVLAAGLAAAVLLLALGRNELPPVPPSPDDPEAVSDEPLTVASADDVRIISMDDRDRGALVVGEPPVNEPIELATTGDVRLTRREPDDQGRVGQLQAAQGDGALIVMQPVPDPEDDP